MKDNDKIIAARFVFAPSPRRVTVEQARELLRQTGEKATGDAAVNGAATAGPAVQDLRVSRPLAVGDCSAAEIARIARLVGLAAVQLHGSRGPRAAEVRQALARWAQPRPSQAGSALRCW
jgi:phosphoribosylanthranilate isomerase